MMFCQMLSLIFIGDRKKMADSVYLLSSTDKKLQKTIDF